MGINATAVHYGLMSWLSVVVVSAFESVGAILVIAMLILPGATARLLSNRLGVIMVLTLVHCAIVSVFGVHLAYWLNCSMAAAIVVVATMLFAIVWVFSPTQGLVRRGLHKYFTRRESALPGEARAAVAKAGVAL
jgi:manganese/zinc/iron transport system permease protein